MSRKAWLGVALATLVGCGGRIATLDPSDDPGLDPERPQHPLPTPGKPGKPGTSTPRPSSPVTPEPDPTGGELPPVMPNGPDPGTPIVPPGPCRTILSDATGVHLARLTFAFQPGASPVEVEAELGLTAAAAASITSLGRQGNSLFACSLGKVIRIGLADLAIEETARECEAVTADDSAIWVQSSTRGVLERYTDFAAVVAGPSTTFLPMASSQIAVQGNVVVATVVGAGNTVRFARYDADKDEHSLSAVSNVSGLVPSGVDLAADGSFFLTYATGHSYGRAQFDGNFEGLLNLGKPAQLHGVVCQ